MGIRANYASATTEQFKTLQAHPERIWDFLWGGDGHDKPASTANIDKAWQALSLFLTGDPWRGDGPFGAAIFGGRGFGPDHGMGQARYLTPDQVRTVAAALEEFRTLQLMLAYDPEKYEDFDEGEIYVYGPEELAQAYSILRRFYLGAAERGEMVLSYIG